MSQALDQEIRELRARFWSQRDPEGRAFAPLADAYRRKGDLDEALSLVEDGLARLPDFTSGQFVAARVFRAVDDAESARRALDRLLELDPRNTLGLLERAEVVGGLGDPDAAAADLKTLLALEPGHLGARTLLDRMETPPAVEPAADSVTGIVPQEGESLGQPSWPEPEPEPEPEPRAESAAGIPPPEAEWGDEPESPEAESVGASPFIDLESGWEEFARDPAQVEEGDLPPHASEPLETDVDRDPGLPPAGEAVGDDPGFLDADDFDVEEFPTADLHGSSLVADDPVTSEPGEGQVSDEFGLDAFTADIQPGGWDAYEDDPEDAATADPDLTGEMSEVLPETSPEMDPDRSAPIHDDPMQSAEQGEELPYLDLPYLEGTEVEAASDDAPTPESTVQGLEPEIYAWETDLPAEEVPTEVVPDTAASYTPEPFQDLEEAEVVEVEPEPEPAVVEVDAEEEEVDPEEVGVDPEEEEVDPEEVEPEPAVTGAREWASDIVPDSPQLMTRTMAEIYVQQGLTARAVNVYESLVDRNPSDEALRQRLEELRHQFAEEEAAEPSLDESAPQWVTSPSDDEERVTPFAWDPDDQEDATEATDGPAVVEAPGFEEAGRSIGLLFDDLLSWEPGAVPIGHLAPESAPELAPRESALARALASGAPLPGREPEPTESTHEPESASPHAGSVGSTSPATDAGASPEATSDTSSSQDVADGSEDLDDLDDFRSWLKSLDP